MALTVTAAREEMTRSQLEGEIEIMSVCEWRCCIVVGEERTATCKERVLGKVDTDLESLGGCWRDTWWQLYTLN